MLGRFLGLETEVSFLGKSNLGAMDALKAQFLRTVLGLDGASALIKAAERSPEIEAVLVPRSILAWLGVAASSSYEGGVPGLEIVPLSFVKSEGHYTGSIGVGTSRYDFIDAPMSRLASAIAVALGVDSDKFDPALRNLDLARLAKSIDLLAKTRVIEQLTKSKPCSHCGCKFAGRGNVNKDKWYCRGCSQMDKAEAPGPPGPAIQQVGPEKASAQTSVQPNKGPAPVPKKPLRLPGQVKPPTMVKSLKVSRAASERPCELCGLPQFRQGQFTGCLCLRSLCKSTATTVEGEGYRISFGTDWDTEAIETLIETLRIK